MKDLRKFEQKMEKHFKAHPRYNALVHSVIGVGLGILAANSVFGQETLKWGVGIAVAGIILHLYPVFNK